MRYYIVEQKDHRGKVVETRLFQATSGTSALLHVAKPSFNVKKASPEELVDLMLQGRKPEVVEPKKRGRPGRKAA